MRKKGKPLRKIADPFAVAPPTGASIRVRLKPQGTEQEYLVDVGALLGHYYRVEVADRVRAGRITPDEKKERACERKRALTEDTSARWAGAITREAASQYGLSRRAQDAYKETLTASITKLKKRLAVPVGEKDEKTGVYGYKTKFERYGKEQRLAVQERKLALLMPHITTGSPSLTLGSKALWQKRNTLDAADLSVSEWRAEWDAKRAFFTAHGEKGRNGGNETIRVIPNADGVTGTLAIKTPNALAEKWGDHVTFTVPVNMDVWRGAEWRDRAENRQSLTYKIWYNTKNQHWYIDISWSIKAGFIPTVEQLGSLDRLAVDLNEGHLAVHVLDRYGNPKGPCITVPLVTKGLSKGKRDNAVRSAITDLLNHAKQRGISVIAIENLNFSDSRDIGRETMGRGKRGKKFRATVAGLPTAQFRDRLTAMAYRAGVWIIAVDPAYTSKWGKEHWFKPLQAQYKTSLPAPTSHDAAAVGVGRRSVKLRIRRKPEGPRNRQRTVLAVTPEPVGTGLVLNGSTVEPVHPRTVSPNGHRQKKTKRSTVKRGSSIVREPVTVSPTVTN